MAGPARITRLAAALLACVSLTAASAASAFQLRGTVYGDSRPLAGATVTLADGATAATPGSTISGPGGAYAFAVGDGRYDLTVTAAGYLPGAVKGIDVAGGDVVQDILLMGRATLGGAVRTSAGEPVPGVEVLLWGADVNNWQVELAERVTTDAAGRFLFDPAPGGLVVLRVEGRGGDGRLPEGWEYVSDRFALVGSLERDVVLPPVATLRGRTTDPQGAPVAGARLAAENYLSSSVFWGWYAGTWGAPTVSNAAGEYALRAFADPHTEITVTPPPGRGWSGIHAVEELTADRTRDFAFSRIVLAGAVRTSAGEPAPGVEVVLWGADEQDWQVELAERVTTDAAGRFRFDPAPSGFVVLRVEGGDAGGRLPGFWEYVSGSFTIRESLERDVVLPPVATLRGRTIDARGVPVAGARIAAENYADLPPGSGWYASTHAAPTVSDAAGEYALRAFADAHTEVTVTPPAGRGWSEIHAVEELTADRTRDFVFSRIALSGTVRTRAGEPVAGVEVLLWGAGEENWQVELTERVTTDPAGRFLIDPAPTGLVVLRIEGHGGGRLPTEWSYVSSRFTISASLERDAVLPPVATLHGRTTDANGVPVAGVGLAAANYLGGGGGWYASTEPAPTVSDPAGEFDLLAFAGVDTLITVTPPAGSGFSDSRLIGVRPEGDRLFNVILALPDLVPPAIIAGPVAAKVTDTGAVIEWQTDEPALGGLLLGVADPPGKRVDETEFATLHALPLAGLTPGTTYFASVFAADAAGNGPTASGVISFRTLAAPDATPPVFTFGPVVEAVTHDAAVVAWATDEACSGVVRYGPEGTPGTEVDVPDAATARRVTLEGLEPATAYTVVVACADGAGNLATSSAIPFTTAPEPDTTPPAIVEGPLVTDVTAATATVEWTTDEPATSGVSWNDGTAHGLVSDPALSTAHRVTITGLLPATAYELTVSSSDGAGNGPTLGGPLPFRTKAAGDTRPPVIVDGPAVVNVTRQSAVIRWETDEPADGVVEYGIAPDALVLRDGHAALTRPHNQAVTGLEAGTTYFFRVCSTDAAGNTGCSAVLSLRTDGEDDDDDDRAEVSGLATIYRSERSAVVSWRTSIPTDSRVRLQAAGGRVRQAFDGAKVLEHRLSLAGLEPSTAYAVRVGGANERGVPVVEPPAAGEGSAPHLTFTTLAAPDSVPPVIVEGPAIVEVGDTRAVVRWVTDEIADSVVRFGPAGGSLDGLAASIDRTTEHRVALTNLRPGTAYRALVRSGDPAGNPRVESGFVDFTTAAPAPLFADAFADAAAGPDPDWLVVGGGWSGASGAYVSSKAGEALSTVGRFAAAPLAAGVVRAKVKLTSAFAKRANGAVVFSLRDAGSYRYVRLEEGRVVIGQRGDFGGARDGVRKTLAAELAVGRARVLTVEIHASGRVRVFLGRTLLGTCAFPSAVPGGVGLATSRARTVFDDIAVWDAAALGE